MMALALTATAPQAEPGDIPHPELRLLDGGMAEDGDLIAGVSIRMEEGWKTYWRTPGDSGIPPSFDFSGSRNVAAVEILWPAPAAYHDGYGWVIGYEGEIVFPVRVTPQDAGAQVALSLDLDYGVCLDICIPVEGEAAVTLTGSGRHAESVGPYLDRVPVKLNSGDPRGSVVAIEVIDAGERTLAVEIGLPGAEKPPLLLIEGPTDWYLPLPEHVAAVDGDRHRFRVALDGIPQVAEISGTEFRLTVVSDDFAFEQTVTIE